MKVICNKLILQILVINKEDPYLEATNSLKCYSKSQNNYSLIHKHLLVNKLEMKEYNQFKNE